MIEEAKEKKKKNEKGKEECERADEVDARGGRSSQLIDRSMESIFLCSISRFLGSYKLKRPSILSRWLSTPYAQTCLNQIQTT